VTIKYTVPKRITSGSEVLWAPVALSTVRFESICTSIYYEDDTVVALHSNYGVDSEAGQFASRWPQPFMHQVPNHGQYHLDWTGDVTAFSEDGDYTFQLFGTEAHDPVGDDEYAVIVQFKFLKPCKLLFYVDGRKVDGGVRRTDMDLTRDVGFSYPFGVESLQTFGDVVLVSLEQFTIGTITRRRRPRLDTSSTPLGKNSLC